MNNDEGNDSLQEAGQIGLRSEEVNEIMGQIPNRIIRYGIGVIASIMVVLFIFSFFFKYPDVITGRFYVQSVNPPAFLVSRSTGKIQSLFVRDNDHVGQGALLAVIENATDYESYARVKALLQENVTGDFFVAGGGVSALPGELGELQSAFASYQKAVYDYTAFGDIDYHRRKLEGLAVRLKELDQYILFQRDQLKAARENYSLAAGMYRRDSLLFVNKTIAALEYEKSQRDLVAQRMALTNVQIAVSNATMSRAQLEQDLLEVKMNRQQQEQLLKSMVVQATEQLKGTVSEWEKKYCLVSPIEGRVAFSGVWEVNQNVTAGQHVMTILPFKRSELVCKIAIPVQRAGTLAVAQPVNLKFVDFPYREYGMVVASLDAISAVPDSAYIGTVALPDSLVTNYGRTLPFKQNMQGEAEIITENLSLAERLINPIKAIYKQQVQ